MIEFTFKSLSWVIWVDNWPLTAIVYKRMKFASSRTNENFWSSSSSFWCLSQGRFHLSLLIQQLETRCCCLITNKKRNIFLLVRQEKKKPSANLLKRNYTATIIIIIGDFFYPFYSMGGFVLIELGYLVRENRNRSIKL